MTTQASTKVRIVRCPRCREVLAELPEVPLYKCGGCGTILQAKSRKTQTNNPELSSPVTDAVAETQNSSVVSEEEEARSSNQNLRSPPKEESFLDKDTNKKHRDESTENECGNMNMEHELEEGNLEHENGDRSTEHELEEGNLEHENGDRSTEHELEEGSPEHVNGDRSTEHEYREGIMEYEHGDRRMELHEETSVSDSHSTSPEVKHCDSEDLPVEVLKSVGCEDSKWPMGQSSKNYDGNVLDCNGDWPQGRISSDGFTTSSEIEESTTEASEHVEQDDESSLSLYTKGDQREAGTVLQDGINSTIVFQNLSEHEDQENDLPRLTGEHEKGVDSKYCPLESDEKSQDCLADQNGDFYVERRHDGVDFSSADIISHENGPASQYSELSVEVDDDMASLCASRKPTEEEKLDSSVEDITVASQSALNGNIMQMNLTSPDNEHPDHSIMKVIRHSESASSVDTIGTSPLAELSSELPVKHRNMVNSPTRRYYAYDGSESSYDGTEDQIPKNISRPPRRKSKNVDHISSSEMLKNEGLRVNSMLSSEPDMKYQRPSPSSTLHDQQHFIGNRMRLDKEGDISRLPFTSREFPVDHRTESPSVYHHDMLPPRPNFHSPDKHSYSVPDKLDLLRTVCELKEQLDRIQFPKVAPGVRFPSSFTEEQFAPHYYNHLAPEREMFADSYHPAYPPQPNRAEGWAERCNAPRLAFSGEVSHYRHQVKCSCLHCCPQYRPRSGKLPLHSTHCNNSHCLVQNDHISSSSSPQHYSSSELSLWGRETDFVNQRRRDDEIKRLYLREKYHTSKTHLRPLAGGASILACYHCSEILQLPADFLLFKKRYHQLRCNACKKILKFSLLKRTNIVPYLPDAPAPTPSEVGDRPDATISRKVVSVSRSSSQKHVEPVSCSEDYGRSFDRSCSTEGEASITERNRKKSSGSSYGTMEDRKMKSILGESQKKNKSPDGSSSKGLPDFRNGSSEIEGLPPSTNATLHRLMGYSSVSQVFKK